MAKAEVQVPEPQDASGFNRPPNPTRIKANAAAAFKQEDLAPLAEIDKAANIEEIFERAYESYKPKKRRSKETADGDKEEIDDGVETPSREAAASKMRG